MRVVLLAISLVLAPTLAAAQSDYPSRPITLLVPFPPGGSADTVIRPIAQKVADVLKQPIVIDNRPGGGGNVAAVATKQATPDGYTLFLTNMGVMSVNPILTPDLRFDPVKDFAPITPIISFPHILVVPADSPAKTIGELAAYARTKPGGLSFGSQGVGSGGQIIGEMFKARLGAPMVHVPFRGAGPAATEIMAGRIDFLFTSYISVGEQAKAGKLRMIAVAGPNRHPDFPDVPTLEENGIRGVDGGPHFGFYATHGAPRETVERLNREVIRVMQEPQVRDRFKALAVELAEPMTPEQFSAYVKGEHERYARLIPELGIK